MVCRRFFVLSILFVLLAGMLTGCGGGEGTTDRAAVQQRLNALLTTPYFDEESREGFWADQGVYVESWILNLNGNEIYVDEYEEEWPQAEQGAVAMNEEEYSLTFKDYLKWQAFEDAFDIMDDWAQDDRDFEQLVWIFEETLWSQMWDEENHMEDVSRVLTEGDTSFSSDGRQATVTWDSGVISGCPDLLTDSPYDAASIRIRFAFIGTWIQQDGEWVLSRLDLEGTVDLTAQ